MTDSGSPVELDALTHLRHMLGPDAGFRPGQVEAIEAVARDRGRVLLVQRTGWGKSAVYFIATKLLREQGAGPTLLVSPLLALMRNQIEMAAHIGVRAETINSTNPEEFGPIVERLGDDEIDLLLVSPERFANERFREQMLSVIARTVGLLVSTKRTASATGDTTSARTIGASCGCSRRCPMVCPCSARPRPRTTG